MKLEVDGRQVHLKEFLHDMIGASMLGLVTGLRDVEDPDFLRVEVRRV